MIWQSLKKFFGKILNKFNKSVSTEINPVGKILPDVRINVATAAKLRGIKFFVHFTRIENLPSISEHGLLTRKNLDKNSVNYRFNDNNRMDNIINSLSLSITFPNYKMFWKYRMADENVKWAMILLDAEKILFNLPCAFNSANASTNKMRYTNKKERMTLDAFQKMFYDENLRKKLNLAFNETTDPQAEVLCFADIPAEYFKAIVFQDSETANEYKKLFKNISCKVDEKYYFSPRHDWEFWKANY